MRGRSGGGKELEEDESATESERRRYGTARKAPADERYDGGTRARWRSGASKDNDVKHEDHRYRIGLASGTKDIPANDPVRD